MSAYQDGSSLKKDDQKAHVRFVTLSVPYRVRLSSKKIPYICGFTPFAAAVACMRASGRQILVQLNHQGYGFLRATLSGSGFFRLFLRPE